MDARKLTALLIIAGVLGACLLASPSDGETGADTDADLVSAVVQGGGGSIHLDMNNSQTEAVEIYVTNGSADRLSLKVTDIGDDVLTTSSRVSVEGMSSSVIYPAGSDEGPSFAIVTVSVTTDRIADTQRYTGDIVLQFTDTVTGEVFEKVVPLTVDIKSVFTSEGAYNKFFGHFPNTLPAPFDNVAFTAVATLIMWIVATIVVCELAIPLAARLFWKKRSKSDVKRITKKVTISISILMLIIAVNECLNILGANAEVMSSVASLSVVFYVLVGGVLAWQVYVFIITNLFKGLDEGLDVDGVDASLIPLFKMLGKLVICVVAATIILAAYGVDLAGIMVSAGVITLGITFGAQELISQFFSGVVLLSTRPFKKGDFISLDGTTYVVHKVKLMYTEFENWDRDQIITMPNNKVSAATTINYTKGTPNTRIFIYVTVAYDANLTLAKELMIRAANMHPHVIKDRSVIPPNTRLTNFQDSGIEYRLACYVDDYDLSAHYAGQIREIIYKLFLDNGIEIPYNRVQLDILSDCDGRRREGDDVPDA